MSSYSTARVESALEKVVAYIQQNGGASNKSLLGRTSGFWQAEFATRPNFPSVSDYLVFRREGFSKGMADSVTFDLADARKQTVAKEQAHARATYEIFRQSTDPARVLALDEAVLGAPFLFEHHGVHRSAAFWTNAATGLRVQDILQARGGARYPLDILEIGAGWGCAANQLHQIFPINSYAIVDLPQNLALSTTYLASTLGLELQFASGADASVVARPRSVLCALPGDANAIGQSYDVVLNSFSLQEMDLDTVRGYFAWISRILKENGCFISFNSHGKAGVKAPSDYPLEMYHLDNLGMFRAYPSGLLNTIPYEMVLSPRKGRAPADATLLNTLCCLIQFGLGDDLKPICDAFVKHALAPETDKALRDLAGFFSASPARRETALERAGDAIPPAILAYLRGLDAFSRSAEKDACRSLEDALDRGLKGFARLRASAHLAILRKQKTLPKWNEDFDARLAYPELARMLDESNPNQFVVQFDRIVSVELLDVPVLQPA